MKTLKHFSIKTFSTTLAFTILGMAAVNAHAATVDYFLKIDGIEGESAVKGHEKWIDIDSFSWGATGGNGFKSAFSPFSWTQQLDKSVPSMFIGLMRGKHFKNATLDGVRTGVAAPTVFFQMKFDDVLLTKLNIAGTGGALGVAGAFDSYTRLTMTYKQQLADGSYGPAIIGGWDIGKKVGAAPTFFGSPSALEGLFLAQPASPVPVPAAAWLLGSGLLGLIGVARRKAA